MSIYSSKQNLVMVVDDNPANIKLVLNYLQGHGCVTIMARNGEMALRRAAFSHPDVILLDVMMPDMDGFEVCRRLKADPETEDIAVIFMTALSQTKDKLRGFGAGAVDYVTKPLHMAEVLARVNSHLTIRNLQRSLQEQNENLEVHVQAQTTELTAEIARRQQSETEKDKLLEIAYRQSEQLRQLMGQLLHTQDQHLSSLGQALHEQTVSSLEILNIQLGQMLHDAPTDDEWVVELRQALRLVVQLKQDTTRISADLVPHSAEMPDAAERLNRLTPREQLVLKLVADGRTNQEIARDLQVTTSTVGTYRTRLMSKLGLPHLAALVKFAVRAQLTALDE